MGLIFVGVGGRGIIVSKYGDDLAMLTVIVSIYDVVFLEQCKLR